ncbi:MAG: hypothetical protein KAW93_01225 [Methanogenium sp.]|nr:hypothetical protein [Methanogenium sp.]
MYRPSLPCPEGKIMIAKIPQNDQLYRIATGSLLFAIVVAAVFTAAIGSDRFTVMGAINLPVVERVI